MQQGSHRYSVFLVEDEPKLAGYLAEHLRRQGLDVVLATRFDDLKNEFSEADADLVLLDINLPWYDGFYWCRQIRTISTVPVIFISARSDEIDQVRAIENGGDDYVVKPFNLEIVTARIRANLRRAYGEYASQADQGAFSHGGLSLDGQRLAASFAGEQVLLSRTEAQLLSRLLQAQGRVVRREELLAALWDESDFVDDNTLTVNVTRLRKRLDQLGLEDAIRTVRGVGYSFSPVRK